MKLFEHISGNQFKLCEDTVDNSISREEEQQGLQFIRSVAIPYAVQQWNKYSPLHKQLTRQDISFNLKKLKRIKHLNSIDAIIYFALVKVGSKRREHHQFRFVTYKDANGKVRSGVAVGLFLNNVSDYEILDEKGNKIISIYFP